MSNLRPSAMMALAAALLALPQPSPPKGQKGRFTRGQPVRKKKPQVRLQLARGPGSINCKADVLQLARAGRYREAAAMTDAHRRQCGEQLHPEVVLDRWRAA